VIDSHCHLDLPQLFSSVDSVLERAKSKGITRLLIPGTTPNGWHRQQVLVNSNVSDIDIDIALGIHPYFIEQCELKPALDTLETLLRNNKNVAAVGEIGIDTAINCPLHIQHDVLNAQLSLAKRYRLPVILHHRKSHHLLLAALKQRQFDSGGVVHAFSGSVEVAMQYIEKGFYVGIGGTITYPRGAKTRASVKALFGEFSDRILLETDSPDMPMHGRQGQTNEPAYLIDVVNGLAELLEQDASHIIDITTANYHRLFHRDGLSNPTKKTLAL